MKLNIILLSCLLVGVLADNPVEDVIEDIPLIGDLNLDEILEKFGIKGAIKEYGCPLLKETFGLEAIAEAFGLECDEEGTEAPQPPTLEEKVVQKTEIITVVEVKGSKLNVWEDGGKFFVTPLGILDITTLRCDPDYGDPVQYAFYFEVKVWGSDAETIVKNALREKNYTVAIADVLPLPMMEIRPGIHPDLPPEISIDTRWRTNENQPNTLAFQISTENAAYCNRLLTDARATPNSFLMRTALYFEFRMSLGSQNKQQIIIWTTEKDKPTDPVTPPCNEARIQELMDLLRSGISDDTLRQAWLKELGDLINACNGNLTPELEDQMIDLEPVIKPLEEIREVNDKPINK